MIFSLTAPFIEDFHGSSTTTLDSQRFFCQKLKYYLVGGFNPSEKYERSQLGVLFPIYGKLNLMFQTTKQLKHYTIINQVLAQGGAPPVVSWFIIPINYRYNLHKP